MPLYHLPCRNSGDRWKHSLFPEDYLSAERKLAGNSYAIYLLWVSCILFHFIAFFCLSLYTLEQNLQVINYLQPITILKYSIFFVRKPSYYPHKFIYQFQQHSGMKNSSESLGALATSQSNWTSHFSRRGVNSVLYSLPFVGPYNCFEKTQRGLFCHVQLFVGPLDIFRYAFMCSKNYFRTPPESTVFQTNSRSSPNRGF